MTDGDQILKLKEEIRIQGELVKNLKTKKESTQILTPAIEKLLNFKKELEKLESLEKTDTSPDRSQIEDLLKRRFFFTPSFEIYGGVAGLYDFGPMGAAIENNLLQLWRKHFVIKDQMLEVRCSQLTPYQVLKASGHVDKFVDYMVKDVITGDCYRADHLIKAVLETLISDVKTDATTKEQVSKILSNIENYGLNQLEEIIKKYKIVSPDTKNELSSVSEFNLMFSTSIGPTSNLKGFLRPETAQGIFLNFKRLLEFNNNHLPFAAAQIGTSFRNEISPRSSLLRVREFMMAEIEHFVHPENKNHPNFADVADISVKMFPRFQQHAAEEPIMMKLSEAVDKKVVANSMIGYYLGKIFLFLKSAGVHEDKIRFRQHLENEMAHYACDCWDAELHTTYGWVECVGCADRGSYDLKHHSIFTNEKLVVQEKLERPEKIQIVRFSLNRGELGKVFRKEAQAVTDFLNSLTPELVRKFDEDLKSNGKFSIKVNDKTFEINSSMINKLEEKIEEVHVRDVEPHVIEPSFGIGRILYTIFEHSYKVRPEDKNRSWLSFPLELAPIKICLIPISKNSQFDSHIKLLIKDCGNYGITFKKDDFSATIGKRYARSDEIGIPFCITVDFDTVNTNPTSVTIRDRDSTLQFRIPIEEAVKVVKDMIEGHITWEKCIEKYGEFKGQVSI